MRFISLALISSAVALGACGGSDQKQPAPATPAATPPAPAAAAPAGPVTAGTPAPITGKTVEIKMIGDATGYHFDPASVTINAGDGLKFVVVGGGPHNVAFDPAQFQDPAVRAQLDANFGADKMAELSSSLKMNPGDAITISFGGIKPGTYQFNCTPHLAMNMKGTVTVK
jgi:plastocyanin